MYQPIQQVDLRDLREGPDFMASLLDVEAWEAEAAEVQAQSLKDQASQANQTNLPASAL